MGYTKLAATGITWMGGIRAITRAFSFIRITLLARLLNPAQMGYFAISTLVLGFLEIFTETGVNVFLIQEDKKLEEYVDTAWIASIFRGTAIAFLISISSGYISNFFNAPDSKILLQLIALVAFIRGFINPSIIRLQKELTFNLEFYLRTSILVIDIGVSLIVCYLTRSSVGLIWGMIAGAVSEVFISHTFIKPVPVLRLDGDKLRLIINRGRWMTAAGVFNYFFHQGDNIVVGKLLNTVSLGIYQMAYSISILPITEVTDTFGKVTFPVFSKLQTDKPRLFRAFSRVTLGIALFVVPACTVLILFPDFLTRLVLGDQWLGIVPILPILALFGGIRAISGSTSSLFLAIKKQEYVTWVTAASFLGLIIPLIPLVSRFGLIGAAYSALIGSLVAIPVILFYLWKTFSK